MLQLMHILDKWTEYLEKGEQIDTIYSVKTLSVNIHA